MTTKDVLEYGGVALGLAGAVLVSQKGRQPRASGFLLWIGSNALLIAWAIGAAAWGLLAMYAAYSLTSAWGWWNNRAGAQPREDVPVRST